jgi:LCP family protein required for cell wall assembly
MRTTLKRRIGRATAANGNGHAVFPPAPFAPASLYRQPAKQGRLKPLVLALAGALLGVLAGVGIAAIVTIAVSDSGLQITRPLQAAGAAIGFVVLATLIAALLARRAARRGIASSRWRWVALVGTSLCACALLVNAGYGGGAYLYYNQTVTALVANSPEAKVVAKHLDIPLAGQPTTALIVGSDKRRGGPEAGETGNSDTLMLLRADPINDSISMLSFPRDLRAEIVCRNRSMYVDRINAAYGICGSVGSLQTVKHLTKLPINYLITVDMLGFRQIVDRVDGVWIDVDRRYFNKNVGTAETNFTDIDLRPGYQKVKGERALQYVRYRHTDSDLYRIARQQHFVKSLKQQVAANFSAFKLLKIVGAITRHVEVSQAEGSESLKKAIASYAFFAYDLPAGHFFQAKIEDLQNYDAAGNQIVASESGIQAAVRDFINPDVEAPEKATAAVLGRKAARSVAPPPDKVRISVLNGDGVAGSAANAAYALRERGYTIVLPPDAKLRNAPSFDYFHTNVYYDPKVAGADLAAQKVAALFTDAEVEPVPLELARYTDGAMVGVVVGQTFSGRLQSAPADKTPKRQPPAVREDPAQARDLLRGVQRRLPFPLLVPTLVENTSNIDREMPIRVYELKKGEPAVRLTFLSGAEVAGYWGIEMTKWDDAPVLQQPNVEQVIKGRHYNLYYNGPHLHMVVLRANGATYWVVNTLLDTLSNETMLAVAKGLKPL